ADAATYQGRSPHASVESDLGSGALSGRRSSAQPSPVRPQPRIVVESCGRGPPAARCRHGGDEVVPVSRDGASAPEPREDVREGVRRGILDALALDLDRSSARTAWRLAAAGVLGSAGAVASVWFFAGDGLGSGGGWVLAAACAAAW